mmetsp:Transcript_36565/g.74580  ORF Transcript_36565/g.74580 Transcript_36565/m.74580 type:complete len:228 (+) Transcript_36565:116-799(+)
MNCTTLFLMLFDSSAFSLFSAFLSLSTNMTSSAPSSYEISCSMLCLVLGVIAFCLFTITPKRTRPLVSFCTSVMNCGINFLLKPNRLASRTRTKTTLIWRPLLRSVCNLSTAFLCVFSSSQPAVSRMFTSFRSPDETTNSESCGMIPLPSWEGPARDLASPNAALIMVDFPTPAPPRTTTAGCSRSVRSPSLYSSLNSQPLVSRHTPVPSLTWFLYWPVYVSPSAHL